MIRRACPTISLALAVSAFMATVGLKSALADRMSIPLDPRVQVYEPRQQALIAWNGREEILLLSTDLRATRKTKVLEVLPLPSRPSVSKGNMRTFRNANRIINRHLRNKRRRPRLLRRGNGGSRSRPAGRVVLHKRIGAHHVSVAKVLDTAGFVGWVTRFLRKRGVPTTHVASRFRKLVGEYLQDGFQWFVFDIVTLGPTVKSVEPIRYRFKVSYLYYPLRITRLEKGMTTVDLIVLTPRQLRRFPRQGVADAPPRSRRPMARVTQRSGRAYCYKRTGSILVNRRDQQSISQWAYRLLGRQGRAVMGVIRCSGPLKAFNKDMVATW